MCCLVSLTNIEPVRHVGWWNLIRSLHLIQVGNNRNNHFRYFSGGVHIRLIQVSFTVNKGNKFGDLGYCLLIEGVPLIQVSL